MTRANRLTRSDRLELLVAYLDKAEGSVIYLDALYDESGKNTPESDEWTLRAEIADLAPITRGQ